MGIFTINAFIFTLTKSEQPNFVTFFVFLITFANSVAWLSRVFYLSWICDECAAMSFNAIFSLTRCTYAVTFAFYTTRNFPPALCACLFYWSLPLATGSIFSLFRKHKLKISFVSFFSAKLYLLFSKTVVFQFKPQECQILIKRLCVDVQRRLRQFHCPNWRIALWRHLRLRHVCSRFPERLAALPSCCSRSHYHYEWSFVQLARYKLPVIKYSQPQKD